MALHDGKHKAEQLGWKGKQWGIWNGRRLQTRPAVVVELTEQEHRMLLCWLAQDEADRRDSALYRKILDNCQGDERQADAIANGLRLGHREALPCLHEGNLLRCRPGAPVLEAIEAMRRAASGEGALCG
jgi:hypothetical protein